MATDISADSPLISLIRKSFPSELPEAKSYTASELIKAPLYASTSYTETEKAEITQWLITARHIASNQEDQAKTDERLASLNTHLASRTTLLGSKPSVADIAIYSRLAPVVKTWSAAERTGEKGYHHIVRHVATVQSATDLFGLKVDSPDVIDIKPDDVQVPIPPVDPKAEKEKRKKEKEAALAAGAQGQEKTLPAREGKENVAKTKQEKPVGGDVASAQEQKKKEKAEQKAKQKQNKPAPEQPLSPALIDLRVGHILKAEKHPNADSLYVSTIACGDKPGTDNTSEFEGQVVRTVCSGLNGLVPLEEMQKRKIIAVCNLKPVTMRGIKSCAMVLAASPRLKEGDDPHAGPVELVNPPTEAQAGDRVFFDGWEGEPEGQLNPKKKVWDDCQLGFTTTDDLNVAFDRSAVEKLKNADYGNKSLATLKTKSGQCTVKTLKGATVR